MNSNQTDQDPDKMAVMVVIKMTLSISGFVLNVISLVLLSLTFASYVAIRNLRRSVAGKMVINMTVALLIHHTTLLLYHDRKGTYDGYQRMPPVICSVHAAIFSYSVIVLMFLFAAEAVNLFQKIVMVFSKIENYVLKATLVSWITPLFISGFFLFSLLYLHYSSTVCVPYFPVGLSIAMAAPVVVVQLFTWIVFAAIAIVMCYRSCKNQESTSSELKKNLGILLLLFTFLGLSWLVIAAGAIAWNELITVVVLIIDVLQGPVLFVIRVARLKEVRQFWKNLFWDRWNVSKARRPSLLPKMHVNKGDDSRDSNSPLSSV